MTIKSRIIVSSLIIALSLLAGCFNRQIFYGQTGIDDLVKHGFIVDLNSDEESLVRQLGRQPLKKVEEIVDNPEYDEFNDLLIRYYYPGLEVIFYNHRHPKYGWKGISRIEVYSNDYSLKYDLKIGMHISGIYKRFGESSFLQWKADDGLTYIGYKARDSVHDRILFAFRDDKLVRLIWSNWP